MNRRSFLRLTGAIPLSVGLPYLRVSASPAMRWDRVLVLVELNGGNDGLNTVVPYTNPQYYRLRPRLAIARETVLQLSSSLGLNPAMETLMPMWEVGDIAVVQGVGYSNPNRSHFRSIEIWDTGSASDEYLQDGWVSRLLAQTTPPKTMAAHAVVLGEANLGPVAGNATRTIVMKSPEQFIRRARRVKNMQSLTTNPALAHVLSVQQDLRDSARGLSQNLLRERRQVGEFPRTRIGRYLQTAAELIVGGTAVPAIKVSHGSFDTHSNQRGQHDRLLKDLSEALAAFRKALVSTGLWDRVLVMTCSEFGRRAGENGSRGTDHGTAAPHFLLGGSVNGGVYGEPPSLSDLQGGDLRHQIDYRRLYATVAKYWWGLSVDTEHLGGQPPLPPLLRRAT